VAQLGLNQAPPLSGVNQDSRKGLHRAHAHVINQKKGDEIRVIYNTFDARERERNIKARF